MPRLAVVAHQDWVHRMDHHQGVQLGRGHLVGTAHRIAEDGREVGSEKFEPVKVMLSDRNTKERPVSHKFAERRAATQRVSFGIANGRVD